MKEADSLASAKGSGKILFCITHSGGGHLATAQAAIQHLRLSPEDAEIVDIQPFVKAGGDEDYNRLVMQKGLSPLWWPLGVPYYRAYLYLNRGRILGRLAELWRERQPRQVISVMPFVNTLLFDSLKQVSPETPFKILPSDYANPYHDYWYSPRSVDAYCLPTEYFETPHTSRQLLRMPGTLLRPDFYEKPSRRRAEDPLTGLVLFGGHAPGRVLELLHKLDRDGLRFLVLCGNNETLRNELERQSFRAEMEIFGFTDQIASLMNRADFFVGKPGPGSVQEALNKKLPVFVQNDYRVMRHEVPVIKHIEKYHLGRGFQHRWASHQFDHFLQNLEDYQQAMSWLPVENPEGVLRNFLAA